MKPVAAVNCRHGRLPGSVILLGLSFELCLTRLRPRWQSSIWRRFGGMTDPGKTDNGFQLTGNTVMYSIPATWIFHRNVCVSAAGAQKKSDDTSFHTLLTPQHPAREGEDWPGSIGRRIETALNKHDFMSKSCKQYCTMYRLKSHVEA